jgi:hypothetical protein
MDENNEKASLELRKLSLEITDLERPWWKRPTYILAALPTLLALIALSVGFLNGYFSAQWTKFENQKHDLEAQVKEFEVKRSDLYRQNLEFTKENQALKEEKTALVETLNQQQRAIRAFNAVAPFVDQRRMNRYIASLGRDAFKKEK